MVPSDPPGVLRVPILGPNRGMFSKLNGPSPLGSGGHSYTSFSIGRFYAQWNSFGGDVSHLVHPVSEMTYAILFLRRARLGCPSTCRVVFNASIGMMAIRQSPALKEAAPGGKN